jgi:DNA-binding LytR/AlgR family response regulator
MTRNRSVLLVEDDESAILVIQSYLNRLPFFAKPTICSCAGEMFNFLNSQEFDLLLLDMYLPDLSGMDVLQSIPSRPPTIVTTADPVFAVDCYDLDVADYLVKPFSFQRFVRAINRALKVQFTPNSLTDNQAVYLKIGRSIQRFQYDQIEYIEAFGVYSKIWQNGRATIVNEPISVLEGHLPNERFLRIHKSYIIGLASLNSYSHSNLIIGSTRVPLGSAYRPKFEGFLRLLSSTRED